MSSINWRIQTFAELPSTQDYARECAEKGEALGLAVQAFSQTGGRGRQGREWHSPMGNLYMSVVLRPACGAAQAGQMAFVTAVAVAAAIESFIGYDHDLRLKWPNDVLIEGRKCAGILIESSLGAGGFVDYLVIGIGVNILAPPEGAAALKDFCDRPVPINIFRERVLEELAAAYDQWQKEGFAPIRMRWLAQASAVNQSITARLPKQELQGIFRGIDESGALILETSPGKNRIIAAAEIF